MLQKSKIHNAAGVRNNFVTVQMATDGVPGAIGEVLPTWSTRCQRWAGSKPKSGKEFMAAMTINPMLNAIMEFPYDSVTSQITPRDRVIMDGRTLNIAAAYREDENREKMIVWVVEPVEC